MKGMRRTEEAEGGEKFLGSCLTTVLGVPCPWVLGGTTVALRQIPFSAQVSSSGFCSLGPKKVLIKATAVESFLEWQTCRGFHSCFLIKEAGTACYSHRFHTTHSRKQCEPSRCGRQREGMDEL